MHAHEGRRIITACFASHVHRVQQIADAAQAVGRDTTLGLSMKKNVKLAREMGLLNIPESALIDIADVGEYSTPARSASSRPGARASRCRRCR